MTSAGTGGTAPRAVIFDLDGCLVDSEVLSLTTIAALMAERGAAHHWTELRARYLGVSLSRIRADIAAETGQPCGEDFETRFERDLLARYETDLGQIPGAEALLQRLTAAGVARAIATGGSIRRMRRTLALTGLDRAFGAHGYSADQVARGKPAPDIFEFSAAGLEVPPGDCLVLEDSPHGIAGARAAGMRAIGFIGGAHLEGIRQDHAEVLRAAGAEQVIAHLDELDPLLT